MLRAAEKSAKKQQSSSNSPKDGMDQASADEQKGSQGQRPEDIEFSPAPGVVKVTFPSTYYSLMTIYSA